MDKFIHRIVNDKLTPSGRTSLNLPQRRRGRRGQQSSIKCSGLNNKYIFALHPTLRTLCLCGETIYLCCQKGNSYSIKLTPSGRIFLTLSFPRSVGGLPTVRVAGNPLNLSSILHLWIPRHTASAGKPPTACGNDRPEKLAPNSILNSGY